MKKRILSFLMALALVLSVLPASLITVQEASAESILASSPSDHTHDDTWTAWNGTYKDGGKYYLTDDTALSISAANVNITICLNGNDVTPSGNGRLVEVYEGTHVTICDCQATFDDAGNLTSTNKIIPTAKTTYSGLFTIRTNSNATDTARSLTLENVVIDGTGVTPTAANGGAIAVFWTKSNGELKMENCVVKNCAAKDYGAFNFDVPGTLKINNVLFTGNTAAKGGIVNVAGNGDGSVIDMRNSKFQNNAATTTDQKGLGGIINVVTGAADVEIDLTNCEFKSNSADDAGGVIYSSGNMAFTATDCHFEDNQVGSGKTTGSGGAVIRNDGTGTIEFTGCKFLKNKLLNTGGHGGAAILISGGNPQLTVTDCEFTENSAAYQGGVISIPTGNDENSFTNCTFKKNTAGNVGGVALLWNTSTVKMLTFNNCTFEENKGSSGSVLYGNQAVTFNNCTIKNNTATATGAINTSKNVTVSGNTQICGNIGANAKTADLYLDGGKLILGKMGEKAKIDASTKTEADDPDTFMAWADGATPAATTGVLYVSSNPVKSVVYNATDGFAFQGAQTVPGGSASDHTHDETWTAWGDDAAEKTTLPTVAGNYYLVSNVVPTDTNSDVFAVIYANVTIKICLNGFKIDVPSRTRTMRLQQGCNITICDCKANLDPYGYPTGTGKLKPNGTEGSLFYFSPTENKDMYLTLDCVVIDGTGVTNPNGGTILSTYNMKNHVTMNNCVVKNCTDTKAEAGGAFSFLNGGNLTATNCLFSGNSTTGTGGAIYNVKNSSTLKLTDCEFVNNTAGKNGGAIAANNASANIELTRCVFKDNEGVGGGAVSFQGTLKADNCSFTKNLSLGSGGAVRGHTSVTSAVMNNCDLTGNTAHGYGGAIIIEAGTIELNGCDFTKNLCRNASSKGGGAIYGFRSIKANGCTFTQNHSNYDGGAIYADYNTYLTNCTITDNTADNQGGGVYNNSWARLTGGNVITDNTVKGETNNLYLADNYDMQLTGLTAATKLSVTTPAADGVQVLTVNDTTYKAGMVFSDDATRGVVGDVDGATVLSLGAAIAKVGTSGYANAASAVAAAGNDKVMQLLADAADITVANGLKLDLNGKNVTNLTGTGAVILMDTQTDDYDVEDGKYGKITNVDEAVDLVSYQRVNGKRYIVLTDENGTHAHRIYAAVTAKALRTKDEGIGYTAKFGADQVLQAAITGYGMELSANGNAAQTLDVKAINAQRAFENGKDLVFAITKFFETGDVNTNAGYAIAGTPFVQVGTQKFTAEADQQTVTFKQMFNYANDNFNTAAVKDAAKAGLKAMYDKYANAMTEANGWKIDNVSKYAAQ